MDTSHIRKIVIQLINEEGIFIASNTEHLHLFQDVGIDSFAFINLLIKIEDTFGIRFDIMQMEDCADLAYLVKLIKQKTREDDHD
ncbi:acyl carrier protein [Clostridium minihomine]|uniref:acyl carrier protein n=1 Tax=Clostridium minihomine TaxID=2045012 RepID=UPI000C7644F7|nr:acyl carrier protein [Clostridium minihomine]